VGTGRGPGQHRILSAGDAGSAAFDDFNTATVATQGLAVDGFASTKFSGIKTARKVTATRQRRMRATIYYQQRERRRCATSFFNPLIYNCVGGKKIFQNCGAGAVNSIGISDPSGFICGGRTTWASTFFCVLGFSIDNFVPCDNPSGKIIMAPLALTVCVNPCNGFAFPGK
jgi:hypothetical protein